MTKTCFIISSIGKEGSEIRAKADEKFDLIFKPVLNELDYGVTRADKIGSPGSISREIVENIISSDLVIADVSDENPNVFYELAIRNAVKKPVIVFKGLEQIMPFDIYDKRAISIDMAKPRVWENAKILLKKQVNESEKKPETASESILSDFTFEIKAGEKSRSDTDRLASMMKDIQQELRRTRSEPKSRLRVPEQWQRNIPRSSKANYLISIPSGSSVPGCEETDECFIPSNITISVNETVLWSNDDTAAHTITSGIVADGPDGIFDSSLFMSGETFSYTFKKTGTFPYFCMVHPWQTGTIIVE